jgi:regulator of cell morphogenesis and NO signaling
VETLDPDPKRPEIDPRAPDLMPLTRLMETIASVHHTSLWDELDRMDDLTANAAAMDRVQGPFHSELRKQFLELAHDLSEHMMQEERVLFPLIRRMEATSPGPFSHCGSIANIIRKMISENERAEASFQKIRDLAGGFSPPADADAPHREVISGLATLEASFRGHMRFEHAELFSKAIKLEEAKDSLAIQWIMNPKAKQ